MICPVNGIVLDTSSLVDGIYITPSSNPIIVAESDSIAFEINLPETDLAQAIINKELEINLASGQSLKSKITWIAPEAKDGKFAVHLKPDNVSGLRLGQTGQVNF